MKDGLGYYFIFIAFFCSLLVTRICNPDILSGEKFMEFLIIHSIYRYPQIPPVDLWYSGAPFNVYYYYGYWLFASLGSICKIPPQILFNLVMPTIAGISAVNIFAIGRLYLKKFYLLPVIILLLPNVFFINSIITGNISYTSFIQSIRLIQGTNNEYIFASFIYGDIHPHVISFILQTFIILILMYLGISWSKLKRSDVGLFSFLLALSLGALYPVNTWCVLIYYPIVFVIVLTIINKDFVIIKYLNDIIFYFLQKVRIPAQKLKNKPYQEHWKELLLFWVFIPIISIALYAPYYFQSEGQTLPLNIVHSQSQIIPFFLLWGIYLFAIIWLVREQIKKYPWIGLLVIPGYLCGYAVFFILGILLFYLLLKKFEVTNCLIIVGLLAIMFCEIFFFNDNLISTNYRFNTVFKFYSIAQFLIGIPLFIEIGLYLEQKEFSDSISQLLQLIIIIGVIFGLVGTPIISNIVNGISTEPGLRGDKFFKTAFPQDARAIEFLRNLSGSHLLIEPVDYYNDVSLQGRISLFSGIPTLLGQYQHEVLWRMHKVGLNEINQRVMSVQMIYEQPDIALSLMDMYGATLLYIGPEEKKLYHVLIPKIGLTKIYEADGVTIFQRNSEPAPPIPDNYITKVKINFPNLSLMDNEIKKSYQGYDL